MWSILLFACASLVLVAAGPSSPSGRIVGGTDATLGQFPHQISLRKKDSHNCGGTIISKDFILTAAHCVTNDNATTGEHIAIAAEDLSIRAGSLDRFRGGVLHKVAKVIVHELYGSYLYDVALVQLETPLIFSEQIRAIPLASRDYPEGTSIVISGWGRLKTGGDVPRELQWNTLQSLSTRSCQTATLLFTTSLICLAHEEGNGACSGDSGGPAIYNGEIVGIAGFVLSGCGSKKPDGFAKVFYHRDWIIKHANL